LLAASCGVLRVVFVCADSLYQQTTNKQEKIPFRKVTLIKGAKTLGLVGSAIDINTATESVRHLPSLSVSHSAAV
jgi:hypothetical protein